MIKDKIRLITCFSLLFGLNFLLTSCHKEIFTEDPSARLKFEKDTLTFDTVFTTIGSATRFIKIYNPHKQSILISNIYIPGAAQTDFNFNIDGVPGNEVKEIEIRAQDSIYLFCEVTVNPNDPLAISPFIKLDSIVFEYNQVIERIVLLAFGQNANYFPAKSNKGQAGLLNLQGSTLIWDDPKPYIFYGIVYLDNGILQINEGTKVHFWGGLTQTKDPNGNAVFYNDGRLIIGSQASLHVKGSLKKPVVFEGVRLEAQFANVSGQWSGIFFDKNSKGNQLDYVEIKNNLIGLYLDSLAQCDVKNSKIFNNSLYGIYASTADLTIHNSLFYNQGLSGISIETGGNYTINYCSLINFGNTEPALYLSNSRCIDFPFCEIIYESPLMANIQNCVITGSDRDELWMNEKSSSPFKSRFDNCIFRIDELLKVFPAFIASQTNACEIYSSFDKLFKGFAQQDFHPDTLSILENKALPIPGIDLDLDGNQRDALMPDIGCYEYIYR